MKINLASVARAAPLIALLLSTEVFQKRTNLRISIVLMQKRF